MRKRNRALACGALLSLTITGLSWGADEYVNSARQIFKELIEINTTDSVGNVTQASEAMARRLIDAGIPAQDVHVLGPRDTKKNLVVRLHGTGKRGPILFIGHLDVVEAPRVDWATDPFQLVEKDGYFYGRGTQDMKSGDAIIITTLIHLWKEHFKPDRDIIVALTAGEETEKDNGVKWLTENHLDLVRADFVINLDGNGVMMDHGRPVAVQVDAAEKLYADYELSVVKRGGHSSVPEPDSAIYELARALIRLWKYQFPFELNPVTRAYFAQLAQTAPPPLAADLRAILLPHAEPAAIARVSENTLNNALIRTICSATRFEAGHANNALPQLATANVNCRILPGHSAEETRQVLIKVLDDAQVKVRYVREWDGQEFDKAPDAVTLSAHSPPPEVMNPLRKVASSMWPGTPIVIAMATGESDAVWVTAVSIPTYMISGVALERDDNRAHGRDERVGVGAFDRGVEFQYRFTKGLASAP
jgi:acetylornithine deacetylase/succinyl-diaminopimelate desuccinylase-like protein